MLVSWSLILLCLTYTIFLFLGLPVYLAYLIFPVLLVVWSIDAFITVRQPKIQVQRMFARPCYQKRPVSVELTITNPLPHPVRIMIKDEPPFEVEALHTQTKLTIPAKASVQWSYNLTSLKRGTFAFGKINIKYTGSLMMFVHQYQIDIQDKMRVYPDLRKISDERLNRLLSSQTEGEHHRKILGSGGELAQLREFVSGDDYRKMNWKVTAHTGKLVINEYEPEKDQNVFMLFDTGRMLFDQNTVLENRLDYILDSAILLAFNILESGDMVGAFSFNYQVERFVPVGKGSGHLQFLIEQLFDINAKMVESDYREAFQFWQNKNNKRCLLFIYTDVNDTESSRDLISHLRMISRQHLVVCVLTRKKALMQLSQQEIVDEKTAYLKGVALEFISEREKLKRTLRSFGIQVLEVDAENIRRTVVEHYLFLKRKGLF